jgi:hypothetical protein
MHRLRTHIRAPQLAGAGPLQRTTIVLSAVLAASLSWSAVAQPPKPLFPFVEKGKWGFMNSDGKAVIRARFEGASSFHDGLAAVQDGKKKVFIDAFGKVVLEPPFDLVRDFSQGLAAVNIGEVRDPNIGIIRETGRWGYIDASGKLALPMKFTQADSFSEGLAAVHEGKRSGFIDRSGKMVFEAPFDVSWGFHEGVVLVKSRLKMMYLDRNGRRVPSPPLDDNYSGAGFSEGLAAVKIGDKWGYIDKSGTLVIPAVFRDASSFHEGLAAVQPPEPGEERTCPLGAGSSYGFSRPYGYIDRSGRMVIPPTHEYAGDFSEGLASVSSCGKVRFIDKSGNVQITTRCSYASPFSDGLAEVRAGDRAEIHCGYFDRSGRLVRPMQR